MLGMETKFGAVCKYVMRDLMNPLSWLKNQTSIILQFSSSPSQIHHPLPAASSSLQLITHIRLLRNRTLQPPRLQRTPHIPNIPQLHLRLRFLRPRTHVRQQHHFRVIHQTRVDLRFVFVNVETAAGDLALIKSPAPRMSVVTMP